MATATLEVVIKGTDKTKRAFGSVTQNLQKIGKVAIGAAVTGVDGRCRYKSSAVGCRC